MRHQQIPWLAGLFGIVIIGFTAVTIWNRSGHSPQPSVRAPAIASQPVQPAVATAPGQVATPSKQPEIAAPAAPQRENVLPEGGGPVEQVVRVKPGQRLATVNGVTITLKDLLPLPKEKEAKEQMVSAEMFNFLFNRAIERELTFQAARAQGVELTEAQKTRLAEIRARSEQRDPNAFDNLGRNAENLEFEQRDFAGLMLQAALAEKVGVPSPYATSEQVEEYFQQHRSEYAQVPADPAQRPSELWQRVDVEIRMKLGAALQAAHDEQMKKFIERLKANATIVLADSQ